MGLFAILLRYIPNNPFNRPIKAEIRQFKSSAAATAAAAAGSKRTSYTIDPTRHTEISRSDRSVCFKTV